MLGSGRTIGLVFMTAGVLVACGGTAVSSVAVGSGYPKTIDSNLVLWVVLPLIVGSPIIGLGVFYFRRGCRTLNELATIKKQKVILKMISPQGQAKIHTIAHKLQTTPEEVSHLVFDLAQQGLFHGYIDRQDNVLYSKHIVLLKGATHCPHCGGKQLFDGQGIIPCHHCGVQVLL